MEREERPTRPLNNTRKLNRIFIGVLAVALLGGVGTGYILASSEKNNGSITPTILETAPDTAQEDNRTFRDFAEGTLNPHTKDDEYREGTHLLVREGQVPVALTSSVVDLSQYEGKKVKVYGETQKAIKQGWLMDVGKVEEIQ